MTEQEANEYSARRKTYFTLALVALALTAGRISVVTGRDGTTAFLSANDRSRWCTVASLVEHGTYAIDTQIEIVDPIRRHIHPWQTIDKVRHLGPDDQQHYYSSKPPLFPTIVAGVYQIVQLATGMTLTQQPIYLARIILALVNLPLLALFFMATLGCIERVGKDDWSKRIAALGCCFATMLVPFSISLNNHLPAAAATALAAWIYLATCWRDPLPSTRSAWLIWWLAGASAAFAAANELPALSMLVLWIGLFAWANRSSVLPFLIGVTMVALGFFGTNWIAHQSLRPPYAHRGNGDTIATLITQTADSSEPEEDLGREIKEQLIQAGLVANGDPMEVVPSDEEGRWRVRSNDRHFALLRLETGWSLAQWDDWYEYPNTYWKDGTRRGVDRGEPSRLVYFAQMTVGHHGIFSLTPLWLLVPMGFIVGLKGGTSEFRRLTLAILIATTVCFLFYLNRPLIDRNYGGVSVCFRWLLWFAPLWLILATPTMTWFSNSLARRGTLYALLALSVFSMSASLQSPWQSPWIYRFWQFLGWLGS